MPTHPSVPQWIRQMADSDQAVAFYAYQSLLEYVLQTSRPGASGSRLNWRASWARRSARKPSPAPNPEALPRFGTTRSSWRPRKKEASRFTRRGCAIT